MPVRPVPAWVARGMLRLQGMVGRDRAALYWARAWREAEPGAARAWFSEGFLLARLGEPAAACAALEAGLQGEPDIAPMGGMNGSPWASAWFNLGYLRESLGRLEPAEAAFQRALRWDPQLDRAWYGLGLCLIRQQRLDEAVNALRQATRLQPMSPSGWYQLARVHADRGEWQQALGVVQHLQGFEPRVAARLRQEVQALQAAAQPGEVLHGSH